MTKMTKKETNEFNNLPTTSAKIRYLNAKNYTRSEIAVKLNKRYQHVRNVLITPIKNQRK
jgi:hypothetical protein